MKIQQRVELRKLLVPELKQSLKILSLPLFDLKALVENEVEENPFLEELPLVHIKNLRRNDSPNAPSSFQNSLSDPDYEVYANQIARKPSLQDVLLRQLGMFVNSDEELKIGQEIVGNIDENGYLRASLADISRALDTTVEKAEPVLKIIQQFEPAGVGARTLAECLLIQLDLAADKDPIIRAVIEGHLDNAAKKNYSLIAKKLNQPPEVIEERIKKILRLDPKPGRNYITEEIHNIIPDVIITENDDELEISINDEDIPTLNISKSYKAMLKDDALDAATKEFLKGKLENALALLRAVFKRKFTLRKIVEAIAEIQQEAIRTDLSQLKPLTFQQIAQKINMHESTVCRAIMNKYVKLPYGAVALKSFFTTAIQSNNGEAASSSQVKRLIKDIIDREDKKHPWGDKQIADFILQEHGLKIARRTVTKYREELKVLSSVFRRER